MTQLILLGRIWCNKLRGWWGLQPAKLEEDNLHSKAYIFYATKLTHYPSHQSSSLLKLSLLIADMH